MIGLLTILRFEYALWSKELDTTHNSKRDIAQARIRTYITPIITAFGMLATYVSIPMALFLFAFPIAFNAIPGLLNAAERLFGFRLGRGF